jgi:hypothetical protein
MTVEELIAKLNEYPGDLRVLIPGYEDGFNDITLIKEKEIVPDFFQEWYYGQHLDSADHYRMKDLKEPKIENALLLDGENMISEDRFTR